MPLSPSLSPLVPRGAREKKISGCCIKMRPGSVCTTNLLAQFERFRILGQPMRCPQSCALALIPFLIAQIVPGAEQPADLVVLNGKIVTIMTVVATGVMNATFSTILVFVGVAASRGAQAPTRTEIARSAPIAAPLRALTTNPNYFTDGSGKAVYLTGSHTWNDFQDWGTDGSPQPFNFAAYVKMLVAHDHNFTLLWQTELPVFRELPTRANASPDFFVTPQPWQRTGPGNASDGKLKFDLAKFNQAYFDRLRARVQQLNAAAIYAGVYL